MEEINDSIQTKLLDFAKKNFIILALFSFGLIFLGVGVMQMMGKQETEVKFEKGSQVLGSESETEDSSKIKVDVDGEVEKPGLYSLNSDARIQDALVAAGGLTTKANRKAINLAARLVDGQKVYIPAESEVSSQANTSSDSINTGMDLSGGLISLNSATQAELEDLPGIGPVTARKIMDNRPYGSLQELVDKKAVGKSTFEKIKDMVGL